ncbi:hypothetical protein BM43_3188 [Burkholderia gladioli]|uniref:hypothetical protein n=1 Tax=Burkholderia gladioli TaxID=28095 RepID=UPI0005D90800|nr:hypothetical protein [Burkholderia gladioli]AJW99197.1 hypothetical protein BM43_3188 [Burkholderia gladioli]SPU87703.1 Uncharacterised protein [Burkholderia gladioli]
MKATIRADGTLFIEAETGLEAFALNAWCKANLDYSNAHAPWPRMIVSFAGFAEASAQLVPDTGRADA